MYDISRRGKISRRNFYPRTIVRAGSTVVSFSFQVRATQICFGGRKWPWGRKFETPALQSFFYGIMDWIFKYISVINLTGSEE